MDKYYLIDGDLFFEEKDWTDVFVGLSMSQATKRGFGVVKGCSHIVQSIECFLPSLFFYFRISRTRAPVLLLGD